MMTETMSVVPRVRPFSDRAHDFSSNAERGTPDWRMIDSSVPVRNSR